MRAVFVLALILSVVAPSGVWDTGEARMAADANAAMSSPASALCQLVRDSAKAEKIFAGGWCAAPERHPELAIDASSIDAIANASPSHVFAIDCLPLAPRPPPLS